MRFVIAERGRMSRGRPRGSRAEDWREAGDVVRVGEEGSFESHGAEPRDELLYSNGSTPGASRTLAASTRRTVLEMSLVDDRYRASHHDGC